MSCWSPYTSAILISLTRSLPALQISVLLSLRVEIISQLRKDSLVASHGLYHVTTTTGFDLGLRISKHAMISPRSQTKQCLWCACFYGINFLRNRRNPSSTLPFQDQTSLGSRSTTMSEEFRKSISENNCFGQIIELRSGRS